MREDLKRIMESMPEKNASDLHISVGSPMHYRIDEDLVPVPGATPLSDAEAQDLVYSMLSGDQIEEFEETRELDMSLEIENIGRYRINVFFQQERVGCAIRLIPLSILSLSECGLPENIVRRFCQAKRGLVLVTGATGSGKSTTLAAMVDEINNTRKCHIVTVEDPIEFVHKSKKAIIDQRQLGKDTKSFSNALIHVLRQDPDVILVGELRDLDTIQEALVIADTGHLVLGTLHTSDTVQSINRMIDVFPAHQQKQVRAQLSFVLLGILSQQLIPCKGSEGRVLAAEVMVATPAIRSMIRDSKEAQLYSFLQTSQKVGMKSMNQAMAELVALGAIEREEALLRSSDLEEMEKLLQ